MTEKNRKSLVDKLQQRAGEHLMQLNQESPEAVTEGARIFNEHETDQIELETQNQLKGRIKQPPPELSARNEILETIVGNIPVMICFYDIEGRVTYVNPFAERLIGLKSDEIRQIDIMAFCYPDPVYRQEIFEFMQQASGEWKDIIMSVGEGKTRDVSWANVLLSDGSYIGIGIDVSNRKKSEKIIEQNIAELELKNRELAEYTSVASHDLQEPLRKVQTFGRMLESELTESISETGRDYLSRMISATERMHRLITALLDYSRIGSQTRPFKQIDLKKIAEKVIDDLSVSVSGNNVKDVFTIGDMGLIEGDEIQIRQLMQNLLSNSLNYIEGGQEPRVSISSRRVRPIRNNRKEFCELRIKDNGIGFDTRYRDKIFMPFQRLHSRQQYNGTGMGLAICRKIVERHSGNITAESSPGQGATFIVNLPVRQSDKSI